MLQLSRNLRVVLLASLFAMAQAAVASPERPYTDQAFKAARAAGRPVLVEIHADWCPTCKAQRPILDKLSREPAYAGVERLRVDFDSQKRVVKRFKATMQSTLVLFKGETEIARSVGETDEGRIRAMLDKAR